MDWYSVQLSPGRKVYGRTPEEARHRVAAAKAGRAIEGPQPPWLDSEAGNGSVATLERLSATPAAPRRQTPPRITAAPGFPGFCVEDGRLRRLEPGEPDPSYLS